MNGVASMVVFAGLLMVSIAAKHGRIYRTARRNRVEDKIGDEVVILRAEGYMLGSTKIPLRDPHPEHIGKIGRITALKEGESPHIVLDDGTELDGCECWWRKLQDSKEVKSGR